jgi:type 1 glutamine amidotransferase
VELVDENHPVTWGMEDFTIHDEGYSNITVLDQVTPLLTSDHPDSSPIIGWAHTRNKSQVVYLMLGHDKYAYQNPAFIQLLENSVYWLTEN